jgi:hypothetical protein
MTYVGGSAGVHAGRAGSDPDQSVKDQGPRQGRQGEGMLAPHVALRRLGSAATAHKQFCGANYL